VAGHRLDQQAGSVASAGRVGFSGSGHQRGGPWRVSVWSLTVYPRGCGSATTNGRSGRDDFRTDEGQPRMRESSSPRISSRVTVWSISISDEKKVRRKLRPRLRISSSVHPGSTCRSGVAHDFSRPSIPASM
jgi:hypothetical protein